MLLIMSACHAEAHRPIRLTQALTTHTVQHSTNKVLTNSKEQISPWILIFPLLLTKFPIYCGIFITVFTTAIHLPLSWAHTLHHFLLFLLFYLILSYHLYVSSLLCPSGFPTKFLHELRFPPLRAVYCTSLIIWMYIAPKFVANSTNQVDPYRAISPAFSYFVHFRCKHIPFSHISRAVSSLVRDQVSHLYKTGIT